MEVGSIVYYVGEYDNCHNYEYEITYIYRNGFGLDWWYDLKAVKPNILTHYTELLSVQKNELSGLNK